MHINYPPPCLYNSKWKHEGLDIKFTIQTRADRIKPIIENLKLLKSIGLQTVTLGLESGSDEVLFRFNKGIMGVNVNVEAIEELKMLGILYNMSFIMYEPLTTLINILYNGINTSNSLKIQRIGISIKRTDLEFMSTLLDGIQRHLSINDIKEKYISIMNVDIQKKINNFSDIYDIDKYQFRGWHGPMNVLLDTADKE